MEEIISLSRFAAAQDGRKLTKTMMMRVKNIKRGKRSEVEAKDLPRSGTIGKIGYILRNHEF